MIFYTSDEFKDNNTNLQKEQIKELNNNPDEDGSDSLEKVRKEESRWRLW